MSRIGEKRPADESTPNGETASKSSPLVFGGGLKFSFRPSSLGEAASTLPTYSTLKIESPSATTPGGLSRFKTDTSKPALSFTSPRIMTTASPTSAATSSSSSSLSREATSPMKKRARDEEERENLFLRCLSEKSISSPSSDSSIPPVSLNSGENKSPSPVPVFGHNLSERVKPPLTGSTPTNMSPSDKLMSSSQTHDKAGRTEGDDEDDEESGELPAAKIPAFGSTRTTALLPEVERVTGEEGEKHILQIHCKLYVFDSSALTWRERGRGDLRLNDVPRSEGVFQSRLVMRATGSLRVLLNTHLWAQMKCEQATPKNIRITAQDEDKIGIFLIVGTQKDVHQLFTAVNRRLLALQRTSTNSKETQEKDKMEENKAPPLRQDRDSDEEEDHRSPSRSPEWTRERASDLPCDPSTYHPPSSSSSSSSSSSPSLPSGSDISITTTATISTEQMDSSLSKASSFASSSDA